ncbi:MAG: copper ion binding protein [Christensenellaceae bacterium]|jgi:copper chaperone|nr:copper ion binding protein [Christensenellaceae bacterium]
MTKTVLKVEGMSCEHCVRAVTKAVGSLPGIGSVAVELEKGLVTVEHDKALSPVGTIAEAIEDQGYDVAK